LAADGALDLLATLANGEKHASRPRGRPRKADRAELDARGLGHVTKPADHKRPRPRAQNAASPSPLLSPAAADTSLEESPEDSGRNSV
jgi:hypothetical protein